MTQTGERGRPEDEDLYLPATTNPTIKLYVDGTACVGLFDVPPDGEFDERLRKWS
jgi:hypothetical protein